MQGSEPIDAGERHGRVREGRLQTANKPAQGAALLNRATTRGITQWSRRRALWRSKCSGDNTRKKTLIEHMISTRGIPTLLVLAIA
ncbi:MAG: hypothetical protein OEW33_16075, partial [Nitrospirota bacterium]|nr:hypothetical protein [Nitrospirota bacterium]